MATSLPKEPEVLGIISARAGSKGLPGKNTLALCGKPLIAWTIEAALAAEGVDRVIVTTEDAAIAEEARKWGAEVPFMRPVELAADETPGIAPVLHCLEWLRENEGYTPAITLLLQPTSPLRGADMIEAMLNKFIAEALDAMVSVSEVSEHPELMKRIDAMGRISPFLEGSKENARRQDNEKLYIPNGAMYLARTAYLIQNEGFYTEDARAFIMSPLESVDIDGALDFRLAECLMSDRIKKGTG